MPMSNYPGGFAEGISIRGVPLVQTHPGQVFWVGNSTVAFPGRKSGSDSNKGTFLAPFATLDYAIGRCTASRGDIIFVLPGHAENVATATALALDVAGVAIVGLGSGALRPTITLNTATTATLGVSANNISIQNLIIKAGFADIVAAFTLSTADYFTLENCLIEQSAVDLNVLSVIDTGTTDNASDGLYVSGNTWLSRDAATLSMVKMDCTSYDVTLHGNYVVSGGPGTGGGALMRIATGKVVTSARVTDNKIECVTGDAGTNGVLITTDGTTNTGMLDGNRISHTDTTTEVLVTASSGFSFGLNYASGVKTASGYLLPAADS